VVVTVAYDSGAVLPALAAELARQSRPPRAWLVVDNSPLSAPLGLETLAAPNLAVRPLAGDEGDGFGAGCNRAFDRLEAEGWRGWVWLLNPDTALPRGEELAQLRLAAQVDVPLRQPARLLGERGARARELAIEGAQLGRPSRVIST
jgi:GT2 family glycosyltransferase